MSFSLTKRLSLGVLCLGLLWGALSAPRQTAARSAAASVMRPSKVRSVNFSTRKRRCKVGFRSAFFRG